MAEVEIRPSLTSEVDTLLNIDHWVETNRVWQMDRLQDEGQLTIQFREMRLPRLVRVGYPRPPASLRDEWSNRALILTASVQDEVAGYLDIQIDTFNTVAQVMDVVVKPSFRRQGIATALLMSAQEWSRRRFLRSFTMEMTTKNYPGICLAQRLGLSFCGYNDHYFPNQEIALFFTTALH